MFGLILGIILLIVIIIAIWKIIVQPVTSTNRKVRKSEKINFSYGPLNVNVEDPKKHRHRK